MKIGINAGHTLISPGTGAVGLFKESEHTRYVASALINKLLTGGIDVINCTIDNAASKEDYLTRSVLLANKQELDLFISIHFNASESKQGNGCEVYTYKGRQYQDALDVCKNLSALGFKNRGVKAGSGLYVIRKTKAKSMLIEICFCDNQQDFDNYNRVGVDAIAGAIYSAVKSDLAVGDTFSEQTQLLAGMDNKQFVEWIGSLAAADMAESGILASITTAQAILESGYGKTILAIDALNLGGMKAILSGNTWYSEWSGKKCQKWTKEQNPDGTWREELADFRKYDTVSDYLRDHSGYLRGAKNGDKLRYDGIAGCTDYVKGFQIIKNGGYATDHKYVDKLCSIVDRWDLARFDAAEEEIAEDGKMYRVQTGAYKSKRNAESFARELTAKGIINQVVYM